MVVDHYLFPYLLMMIIWLVLHLNLDRGIFIHEGCWCILSHQGRCHSQWDHRPRARWDKFLFKCLNIPTVMLSSQDLLGNSCMCPTDDSHLIPFSETDRWRNIPTDGWAQRQLNLLGLISLYVSSTHVSLHENNLHTTSKDPITCLCLPYMGREA